jgi:hypothetical protein
MGAPANNGTSPNASGGGGFAAMSDTAIKNVMNDVPPEVAVKLSQVLTLKEAAEHGSALVHNPDTCEICKAKVNGAK